MNRKPAMDELATGRIVLIYGLSVSSNSPGSLYSRARFAAYNKRPGWSLAKL